MKVLVRYSTGNDEAIIVRRTKAQEKLALVLRDSFHIPMVISQIDESHKGTHQWYMTSVDWIPDWGLISQKKNTVPYSVDPIFWLNPLILWGLINMPRTIPGMDFVCIIAVENSVLHVMLCDEVTVFLEHNKGPIRSALGHQVNIDSRSNAAVMSLGSVIITPFPLRQFENNSAYFERVD